MIYMCVNVTIYNIKISENVPEITLCKKSEKARLKPGFFLVYLLECFNEVKTLLYEVLS